MKPKMIIAGGSGFLGNILINYFQKQYEIVVLTRKTFQHPGARTVRWNGTTRSAWVRELAGAEVLINLAGKSVNCRYHAVNKRKIFASRLKPTELLGQVIGQLPDPPKVWLNASTATIYRHAEDRPMDEYNGEHGTGFSVQVAESWEKTFFEADTPHTRKVALRTSFVLGEGQALAAFKNLVRFGLGGHHGDGNQFVSWIHQLDFARAVEWLIKRTDLAGPVNVTANHPVTENYFMRVLREMMNVPFGLNHPKWLVAIGAFFLRTETELVLKSRRVIPKRLRDSGFRFHYNTIEFAIADLVSKAPHKAGRGVLEIA